MPTISKHKHYRLGRSRTGLGLFATKPIERGRFIIHYLGRLLDAWNDEDVVQNKYLFAVNSRWTIDGSSRSNTARYINHSCKPNAEFRVNSRLRKVAFYSIADIDVGDEITFDYGREYFDVYVRPLGCKCLACGQNHKRRFDTANAKARSASR